MRGLKIVSPIKVMPSRSLAWAAQVRQRYVRFTDFSRVRILLYLPALTHTLVSLHQRWFTSIVDLHPQLSVSLKQQNIVNKSNNNVSTPQRTLLNLFALANLAACAGKHEFARSLGESSSSVNEDFRRTRYLRDYVRHQRLALTLAINRTSSDLTKTLSQKFQVQREAQVREIATLLTQRVKRINESSTGQPPMSFPAAAASRIAATESSVEARRSRDIFETRVAPIAMPPMAPPALNVEMLANEVIKQIDRRVIARRERMGQI